MGETKIVIETNKLVKRFKGVTAVQGRRGCATAVPHPYHVASDAVKPGTKPAWVLQARQAQVGCDERLLRKVFSFRDVTGGGKRQAVNTGPIASHQAGKGFVGARFAR